MSLWLIRLVLLLLFLALLLIVTIILDAIILQQTKASLGTTGTHINPASLTVKSLEDLLDDRGVPRSAADTKEKLVQRVKHSGALRVDEVRDLRRSSRRWARLNSSISASPQSDSGKPIEDTAEEATYWKIFQPGNLSLSQIEDKARDGACLFMINQRDTPFLEARIWDEVVKAVSRFGVHSAVLSCVQGHWECERRGWDSAQLVLAFPTPSNAHGEPGKIGKTASSKQEVSYYSPGYDIRTSSDVLTWASQTLALNVQRLNRQNLAMWRKFETGWESSQKLRVVLISANSEPPLLISAIATKFKKRIDVGMIVTAGGLDADVKSAVERAYPHNETTSHYLILTPCRSLASCPIYVYGEYQGEALNFRRLEVFLKSRVPETNDLFTLSLTCVSLLLTIDLFLPSSSGSFKQVIRWMLRVVKYNAGFFILWLAILGLLQSHLKWIDWITEQSLTILVQGYFCNSNFGHLVIAHWPTLSCLPIVLSAIVYGAIVALLWGRYGPPTSAQTESSSRTDPSHRQGRISWTERSRVLVNQLFRPVMTSAPDDDVEADYAEYLDLIEQMARSSFWLPLIEAAASDDTDYDFRNLDIWEFKTCPNDIRRDDSGRDAEHENLLLRSVSFPSGMLPCLTCAICLENYRAADESLSGSGEVNRSSERQGEDQEDDDSPDYRRKGDTLCGLPCGHNFHASCVLTWICIGRRYCPICRWPVYRPKPKVQGNTSR